MPSGDTHVPLGTHGYFQVSPRAQGPLGTLLGAQPDTQVPSGDTQVPFGDSWVPRPLLGSAHRPGCILGTPGNPGPCWGHPGAGILWGPTGPLEKECPEPWVPLGTPGPPHLPQPGDCWGGTASACYQGAWRGGQQRVHSLSPPSPHCPHSQAPEVKEDFGQGENMLLRQAQKWTGLEDIQRMDNYKTI